MEGSGFLPQLSQFGLEAALAGCGIRVAAGETSHLRMQASYDGVQAVSLMTCHPCSS